MSQLSKKRQKICKDIRQKNREQIRKQIRQQMLAKNSSQQKPLYSSVFESLWECTHWQLTQNQQKIIQILEQEQLLELSDEDHNQFVTDLLYLVHQNIITVPSNIQFKKNQSNYTACLAAYVSNILEPDELAYWVNYMSDEDKQLLFLNIQAEQQSHVKWIQNHHLFIFLLQNAKWFNEAACSFRDILLKSQYLQKKNIDQSIDYIYRAIELNQQPQKQQVMAVLMQIWMNYFKIYAKMKGHSDKVSKIVQVLKEQISKHLQTFLRPSLISDLNQLYDITLQDYIQANGCEIIIELFLNTIIKKQHNYVLDEMYLFKQYLLRLFYNNWRAKNLTNKGYKYSLNFYEKLSQIMNGQFNHPLYIKLTGLML